MPQLSVETFVSQYIWFISILLAFYYISITLVIPRISEIFKTRLLNNNSSLNDNTNDNDKIFLSSSDSISFTNIIKIPSNLALDDNVLSVSANTTKIKINNNNNTLKKVGENWVKNNI